MEEIMKDEKNRRKDVSYIDREDNICYVIDNRSGKFIDQSVASIHIRTERN